MATKSRLWTALIWPASVLGLFVLTWLGGFLYWKVKIARRISTVRREAIERFPAETALPSELYDAGSRALPYLLQEMQASLSRNDGTTAVVMYREYVDAKWFSDNRQFPSDQRISVYSGLSGKHPSIIFEGYSKTREQSGLGKNTDIPLVDVVERVPPMNRRSAV